MDKDIFSGGLDSKQDYFGRSNSSLNLVRPYDRNTQIKSSPTNEAW